MKVCAYHVLLPIVLTISLFNWGLAFWIWMFGWWLAYLIFGGLRQPMFHDFGVERPRGYDRRYDDTDGSGAA